MLLSTIVQSDKRAYEEAAKRLALDAQNREKIVPELRKESRRKYLTKRKEDKLIELQDDIRDDEFLFEEEILTERERHERHYKKRVLDLARQHDKQSEIEKVQRYHMPEDRKSGKETDQYVEAPDEKLPNYEQRRWEEEHLHSARFSFGAKDAKVSEKCHGLERKKERN